MKVDGWPPPKAEDDGFDDLRHTSEEQEEIAKKAKIDAEYREIADPNLPVASEKDPSFERPEAKVNKSEGVRDLDTQQKSMENYYKFENKVGRKIRALYRLARLKLGRKIEGRDLFKKMEIYDAAEDRVIKKAKKNVERIKTGDEKYGEESQYDTVIESAEETEKEKAEIIPETSTTAEPEKIENITEATTKTQPVGDEGVQHDSVPVVPETVILDATKQSQNDLSSAEMEKTRYDLFMNRFREYSTRGEAIPEDFIMKMKRDIFEEFNSKKGKEQECFDCLAMLESALRDSDVKIGFNDGDTLTIAELERESLSQEEIERPATSPEPTLNNEERTQKLQELRETIANYVSFKSSIPMDLIAEVESLLNNPTQKADFYLSMELSDAKIFDPSKNSTMTWSEYVATRQNQVPPTEPEVLTEHEAEEFDQMSKKEFGKLHKKITGFINSKKPVPYHLVHEMWNVLENGVNQDSDIQAELEDRKEKFIHLMSNEDVKIVQKNKKEITWKDFLIKDTLEAQQAKTLIAALKEAIENKEPISQTLIEELYETLGSGNEALVSELLRSQILTELQEVGLKKGVTVILPDGTAKRASYAVFISPGDLSVIDIEVSSKKIGDDAKFVRPERINIAGTESEILREVVNMRNIDPEAFRAELGTILENIQAHLIESGLERLKDKIGGLGEADKKKLQELYVNTIGHDTHSLEKIGDFSNEISVMLSEEGLEMNDNTKREIRNELAILSMQLSKVVLGLSSEKTIFKGDKIKLDVFNGLEEKKEEADKDNEAKLQSIRHRFEAPNVSGIEDSKYRIALLSEELDTILKHSELTRDILGNEIKELKKALEEKNKLLEELKVQLEEARAAMDAAHATNDRAEIIKRTDIYQAILGEFNKVQKMVTAIKIRMETKTKVLIEIVEQTESIRDKKSILEASPDLATAESTIKEVRKLAEDIDDTFKLKVKHDDHGHDSHEHGNGHGEQTLKEKLTELGAFGTGFIAGLFVIFAKNLWDTIRDKEAEGKPKKAATAGGGGHGH